ncbi:MAG TPA: hypothetical protein VG488_08715 [Candidatus Angelobacter sp.]|jgi:hypothetical protein|nr:hypothetical protein [Candidatus Angelobacter sp.]
MKKLLRSLLDAVTLLGRNTAGAELHVKISISEAVVVIFLLIALALAGHFIL